MSKLTKKDARKNGPGKNPQLSPRPLSISELWKHETRPSLDMNIQLWHNKGVDQWRWTLVHTLDDRKMESGTASELTRALGDIQRTIEWLMEEPQNEWSSSVDKD